MRVPFGRGAAREGDQVRFLLAVQLALLARPRSVIDGSLKSFLHVPLPRSGDRGRVDQQQSAISRSRSPWSALSSDSARFTVRSRWDTSLRRERSASVNSTLYLMAAMAGHFLTQRSCPSMAAFLYSTNLPGNGTSHSRVAFLFVNKHDPYYNPPGVAIRRRPVNQESLFYLCVPLGRVLMFYFCPVLLILCSNPAFHT